MTTKHAHEAASGTLVKHPLPQRLLHWFNAACFLFLWLTGIGIVTAAGYRVAPQPYIDALLAVFGSQQALLNAHIAIGVLWFAILGVTFILDPWGLAARFLRDIRFTRHDLSWLALRGKAELNDTIELPPQGAYNAGQKAFGWAVLLGAPVIGISGALMWQGIGGEWGKWLVLLHLVAVGGVIAFFFVHFTMAALIKEERPALASMLTGDVDPDYARHHHIEWYEQVERQGGEPLDSRERFGVPRMAGRAFKRLWAWITSREEQPYWSPYAAGVGLGLTVLAAFMLTGHGLGASGFFSRLGASTLGAMAPAHVLGNRYWGPTFEAGVSHYWLTWSIIGVLIGGFISAALAGRIRSGVDRGELISKSGRIFFAIIGGILVGFATRYTRGCTSHQALSGGALLSVGAWIFMFSVFTGGFLAAFGFRRLWR